jgi:hypothetical protein
MAKGVYDKLYAEILRKGYAEAEGFGCHRRNGFIFFENTSIKPAPQTGWKFHLSIAPGDVQAATDIVTDVCKKYGARSFKVTDPDTTRMFANPIAAGGQAGKVFTLYDQGEKNWPQMMREIERRFQEAHIKPGLPVAGDARVPGSHYAFRRNDLGPNGAYVAASEAKQINPANPANPYNKRDPLAGFAITPENATSPTPEKAQANATDPNAVAATKIREQLAAKGVPCNGVRVVDGVVQIDTASPSSVPVADALKIKNIENVTRESVGGRNIVSVRLSEVPSSITGTGNWFTRLFQKKTVEPPANMAASGFGNILPGINAKIGVGAVAVNVADALVQGKPGEAAMMAGGAAALQGGMWGLGKIGLRGLTTAAGPVAGAAFSGIEAYQAAQQGKTLYAVICGTEATLYTVAGVSAVTGVGGPVAAVAGGAALTITAGRLVYDGVQKVWSWVSDKPAEPPAAPQGQPRHGNPAAVKGVQPAAPPAASAAPPSTSPTPPPRAPARPQAATP